MTRRHAVTPLPAAYALLGGFILAERFTRQGPAATSLEAGRWPFSTSHRSRSCPAATSLEAGPSDQGTTRAIGRAVGGSFVALAAAPLLNRARLGRVAAPGPAWAGVAAMVVGLALRVWALRVLGASYTRTLRTSAAQTLVESGPYRVVRHPGYLGALVFWLGAGLASANAPVAGLIALAMGRAYRARIRSEEALLTERFGAAYTAYARRTRRLVPGVW